MRPADLPRVEEIYLDLAGARPPADWEPMAHEAMGVGGGPPLAWVATDPRERVLGYIIGQVRSWEFGSAAAGWVVGVGVSKEHQRGRVGGDLLRQIGASFAARGILTVRTMVRRDDVKVLRFFRSAGFTTGPYTELEMEVRP